MAKDPRFDPDYQKNIQQKRVENKIAGNEISNNSILTNHIAQNAITSDKIAISSITSDKIASDAITSDKIAINSITETKIADNAVTANKIATGAVGNDEINTSATPTVNTIYTNNWFRSNGATGWYNETYGGGIWMEDSNYVKVYNNKAFMPSSGNGTNGIIFPSNPGGGSGDAATIKYYAVSGESTTLELKVENDANWSNGQPSPTLLSDTIKLIAPGGVIEVGQASIYNDGNWIYLKGTNRSSVAVASNGGSWQGDWPSGWSGGLATYDITCAGIYTNDVRYRSDVRHKQNIVSIDSSLSKICNLRPVSFDWKPEFYANSSKQYGFIAQEVEKVLPELVDSDSNGFKTLQNIGLIPYLVKAVQEQQDIIKSLESRLKKLEDLLK